MILTTSEAVNAASFDLVLSPTVGVKEILLLASGVVQEVLSFSAFFDFGGGRFLFLVGSYNMKSTHYTSYLL